MNASTLLLRRYRTLLWASVRQYSGHPQAGNLHLSDLGPAQVLAAIQFLSQILPLLANIFIVMIFLQDSQRDQPLEMQGSDVVRSEA